MYAERRDSVVYRPCSGVAPEGLLTLAAIDKSRHLASIFDEVANRGPLTRAELVRATGISRATIARFVEELLDRGLLESVPERAGLFDADGEDREPSRGRPPMTLSIPGSLGQVVGIAFGLRRTVVLAKDFSGRDLHHESQDTPEWAAPKDAVHWLAERVARAREASEAPLHLVSIAIPARVVDGIDIHRPPLSMAGLQGSYLARELTAALGADVVLDSDANMALAAITAEGMLPDEQAVVLLNMGTVLTMARRRRDGSTVRSRSDAFGNLSLIPFETLGIRTTLGAMLSTHGLAEFCAQAGAGLGQLSELWTPSPQGYPKKIIELRLSFVEAVVSALRLLTVSLDPDLILLSGRLDPLVSPLLPQIASRFNDDLKDPPRLLAVGLHGTGHSIAHGAAQIALSEAYVRLRSHFTA